MSSVIHPLSGTSRDIGLAGETFRNTLQVVPPEFAGSSAVPRQREVWRPTAGLKPANHQAEDHRRHAARGDAAHE